VAFHSSFFNPRPRQRGNLASGERPDRKVLLYASVVGYKPAPSNQNKINPCILQVREEKQKQRVFLTLSLQITRLIDPC
jgi:hypothetical protein